MTLSIWQRHCYSEHGKCFIRQRCQERSVKFCSCLHTAECGDVMWGAVGCVSIHVKIYCVCVFLFCSDELACNVEPLWKVSMGFTSRHINITLCERQGELSKIYLCMAGSGKWKTQWHVQDRNTLQCGWKGCTWLRKKCKQNSKGFCLSSAFIV